MSESGLHLLQLVSPALPRLSGGEVQRINLTTALGTSLVNTLFVLDEPSIGLHPRDNLRLIAILRQLRDQGNTVLVVEHDADMIRVADQIVDLGLGAGEQGGRVIYSGNLAGLLQEPRSLTAKYLRDELAIYLPDPSVALYFPEPESLPYERIPADPATSREVAAARALSLSMPSAGYINGWYGEFLRLGMHS